MGIFDIFKKKTGKGNPNGREFTEEDMRKSAETRRLIADKRRMTHQIEALQIQADLEKAKANLADLKEELYGDDDDTVEFEDQDPATTMILGILDKVMSQNQQQNTQKEAEKPITSAKEVTPQQVLSESDISALLDSVPVKHLKKSKKLSDEEISVQINTFAKLKGLKLTGIDVTNIIAELRKRFK
jgi:hypothetical protein